MTHKYIMICTECNLNNKKKHIMKYGIPLALFVLRPGAEWVVRGDDYTGLEWLDSSHTKPTQE